MCLLTAALCGPFAPACESLLTALYGDACAAAAAKGAGQDEATKAGMDACRSKRPELERIAASARADGGAP